MTPAILFPMRSLTAITMMMITTPSRGGVIVFGS